MDGKDLKCSNCETHITPLWRKRGDGTYLCNACGLYRKIHGLDRPKTMKTDVVRHRKRARKNKTNWKLDLDNESEYDVDFHDKDTFLSSVSDFIVKNENIDATDNNDKQSKIMKKLERKKIAKKYMNKNLGKQNFEYASISDKSYDDDFDYSIIESLKSNRQNKNSELKYYSANKLENKSENELREKIKKNYSENEELAIEGLLKLSRA